MAIAADTLMSKSKRKHRKSYDGFDGEFDATYNGGVLSRMKPNELWRCDAIQFPRLRAEISAWGLKTEQLEGIAASMDLSVENVYQILDRADKAFAKIKEKF